MSNDLELDQLADEFSREFRRIESALKASGFLCKKKDAKADWIKFAKEVEVFIDETNDADLIKATNYILENPPRVEGTCKGEIKWHDAPPSQPSKAKNLLMYVCRVRNNLFHGGKSRSDWFNPKRSEELIKHSLVVIRACVDSVAVVKEAYDG